MDEIKRLSNSLSFGLALKFWWQDLAASSANISRLYAVGRGLIWDKLVLHLLADSNDTSRTRPMCNKGITQFYLLPGP